MPVKDFLRKLSNAGRSRASSSTQRPETLPSFPSDPISVPDAHRRALSTEDDRYPQISPRKFEQRYRTRWPSCGTSDGAFGPGGPTAFLDALGMDGFDGVADKELAGFTETLAVARSGVVTKQSSVGEKNSLVLGQEVKKDNQEMLDDIGLNGEKENKESLKNRDVDLERTEELSTVCDQVAAVQGLRVGQEEIQFEKTDPMARKVTLENESRGRHESRKKHHCILEGHLFVKSIQPKMERKTVNKIGDKSMRCQICSHSMKNIEILECDLRACGIIACVGCAQRLDNERREKALESWRLS